MSEPTAAAANNPTEPNPPAPAEPTNPPAPAAGDGGKPPEPAPGEGKSLLSDDKPADGEPKPKDGEPPKEPPKPEGAPEKYEFKDADKYDASVLGVFSEAAKEANLTQDAAQKLLETMAPKLAERTAEQTKAIQEGWRNSTRADKEFGGEKLNENLGVAKKALEQFGTPELRTLLDNTDIGSHPEVVRFMYRVGKAISEDKFVTGQPSGDKAVNPASVLYDNTTRKE